MNKTYTDFFREASIKRYALHRYHYSYTHLASTEGTVYFKPMFFDYPSEPNSYLDVEKNILLGDSIKVSVVLDQGEGSTFYFPGSGQTWCPIWPKYKFDCYPGNSRQIMASVKLDEILSYIKSGSIIPLQLIDFSEIYKLSENYDYSSVQRKIYSSTELLNIELIKAKFMDLGVLTDSKNYAKGWARFDDGETLNLNQYSQFEFEAKGATPFLGTYYIDITVTVPKDDSTIKDTNNQKLGSIIIYNASQFKLSTASICQIKLKNGQLLDVESFFYKDQNICRFIVKDGIEPNMREIDTIHITHK